nr:MAG TPA: hypothetical protein [Caudoviricetes sp.]
MLSCSFVLSSIAFRLLNLRQRIFKKVHPFA